MPARLPHPGRHQDGGVEADDVVALLHHRPPPGLHHVALEQHAERPVVVGRPEPAVDLARREHEAPPLGQVDDLLGQIGHPDDRSGARSCRDRQYSPERRATQLGARRPRPRASPAGPPPGGRDPVAPHPVAPERPPPGVPPEAVELDGDPLAPGRRGRPGRRARRRGGSRTGGPARAARRRAAAGRSASRPRWPAAPSAVQASRMVRRAAPPPRPELVGPSTELVERHQPPAEHVVDRLLQQRRAHPPGQVDHRPGRPGDRDAVVVVRSPGGRSTVRWTTASGLRPLRPSGR